MTGDIIIMKLTASNIFFNEFIGLNVTVLESSDDTLKGLSGEVVDETKHTLKIRSSRGFKTISKAVVTLRVELPDGESVTVDGRKISYRPEDRIGRMKRGR